MKLTHARLLESLHYDPSTGYFVWRAGRLRAGRRAGCLSKNGYRKIFVDGEQFLEHRLAWFYVHGEWPPVHIDHINLERADNRIANLRAVTPSENMLNRRQQTAKSGFRGVRFHSRDKLWQAYFAMHGKFKSVGYFKTPEAASVARERAVREAFGEYYCPPPAPRSDS